MSNLVVLKKQDNQEIPVTTSKVIAEGSGNKHDSVQKLISRNESDFLEFGKLGFEILPSVKNQAEKVYLLNEDQALLLITYMRNNKIVRKLKIALIKEFRAMKDFIKEKHSQQWQDTRLAGKLNQKELNDSIKAFVDYAISQGSQNSQWYYRSFASLTNNVVGIKNGTRDLAPIQVLSAQAFILQIVSGIIETEMAKGTKYKQIYKLCKDKVTEVIALAQPIRRIAQ